MLKRNDISNIKSIQAWAKHMENQCQKSFSRLLSLNDKEKEFLDCLFDQGKIEPSLMCDDEALIENIKSHPTLRWSVQNNKINAAII